MLKRLKNIIKRIHSMKLNKKIILAVVLISLSVNICMMIVISILAGKEITNKSTELIKGQFEMVNNLLVNKLDDFAETSLLIGYDQRVKDYLMYDNNSDINYLKITNEAYNLVRYSLDSDNYIDYISLVKLNDSQLIYVGETWTNNDFREKILENYYNAQEMNLYNFKISFDRKIFNKNKNVINLYTPISNKYFQKEYIGFLVIGIGVDLFNDFYTSIGGEDDYKQYIIDNNGIIISHKDKSMIGNSSDLYSKLDGDKGEIKRDKNIIVYQKIQGWNWYIVNEIPKIFLIRDTYITLIFIILIMGLVGFIVLLILYKLNNKLYEPIDVVVKSMDEVAKGNLEIRIENKYEGTDFKQITRGFNVMIEEINLLMDRVKNEENQIKQIELNRLQSQIKPHFLYNTLECIHWQALADGSKNASNMVKALARFYRVSLSSGKLLISIDEEIKLINNYLIIQNMRYSDIVKLNVNIHKEYYDVLIPKMTLQPLVENSIYHGIKIKNGLKGEIYLSAIADENKIIVSLSDTGVGMNQEEIDTINNSISIFDEGSGYGLRNVNKRIEMAFGREYGLFYRKNEKGQTTVDISLPRRVNKNV
ncbi:sensor histidine kinase [uncultured Clostridium sp.]|uniref:sensor histidine kinase n=1 Tax=uncultured Clostridium sp. TaxID=59620 RepID=UPI0025924699|nr:sensor histidine kinase [uncultured Clostridium sp.]